MLHNVHSQTDVFATKSCKSYVRPISARICRRTSVVCDVHGKLNWLIPLTFQSCQSRRHCSRSHCLYQASQCLAADIQLISDSGRRHLRSASDRRCVVLRTQNIFGDRSFCVAGPRVWNRLPSATDNLDIVSWNHFCLGTVRPRCFMTNCSMSL